MKRLAIYLDGTFNTLNNNTNVWLLKCLTAESAEQRVYYSKGVGTIRGKSSEEGVAGYGIDDEIIEAYTWLIQNFDDGDEIFIFGFSRGCVYRAEPVGPHQQVRHPEARRTAVDRAAIRPISPVRGTYDQVASLEITAFGREARRSLAHEIFAAQPNQIRGRLGYLWAFLGAAPRRRSISIASWTLICVSTTNWPSMRLRLMSIARISRRHFGPGP